MSATLFEKYGGFKTVSRIIMTFYEMVLDSDEIGDFFVDVDMPRQIDHQTKFVASLLGGPTSISDERLEIVHRNLDISHAHFDEVGRLLRLALSEHGMTDPDIDETMVQVESKRSIIVSRQAA